MPWVASPWSRWRTRRWRPQRSLTSGSKSAQKQGSQNFVVKGYHCPEIWLFASVLSGMRRTRNSGVACWGRCVTRPVPPACPCASTPPGCPNCRQNHFLSVFLYCFTPLSVSRSRFLSVELIFGIHFSLNSKICICTINTWFCCLFKVMPSPQYSKKR